MSRHVIGFAGRLQSGKTELAKLCETFGYKKLSVAYPLKEMIACLIGETIEGVNMLKTANKEFVFDHEDQEYIAYRTQIPIEIIHTKLEGRVFRNTREIMQFIGTDLIREYNPSWHVNELRKLMLDKGKYVVDDIRFPNEKKLIESLGGECWFIVRPKLDNVLNHESEISLRWQDFDNIIINNKTLNHLKDRWKQFMSNGYEKYLYERQEIMKKLTTLSHNEATKLLKEVGDKYLISPWELIYEPINPSEFITEDDVVYTASADGEKYAVKNPLVLEDYKFTL